MLEGGNYSRTKAVTFETEREMKHPSEGNKGFSSLPDMGGFLSFKIRPEGHPDGNMALLARLLAPRRTILSVLRALAGSCNALESETLTRRKRGSRISRAS